MNAPKGGAIAYLGNTAVGLGLAGGMQLVDELLRYVQNEKSPLLGDAYLFAHQNLPKKDSFALPYVGIGIPVIDDDSYEWTQKAAVVFGDILIPVWKGNRTAAPALQVETSIVCSQKQISFTLTPPATGTLRVLADDATYQVEVDGGVATLAVEQLPSQLTAGFVSDDHFYGFYQRALK